MTSLLSIELEKKKKKFLLANNIFSSISIVSTFVMITTGILPVVVKETFNESFWGTAHKAYNSKELHTTNLIDNSIKNAKQNVVADINTFNFVKSDENSDSYINSLKDSMLSDLSYYKSKKFLPIDVKFDISLFPTINADELKKQGKFKEITDLLLSKTIPSASFEQKTQDYNFSHSHITIGKNVKNNTLSYKEGSLSNVNCRVNIRHTNDGSLISYKSTKDLSFQSLHSDNHYDKLPLKYSLTETKLFQEFITLHEYFHCLTETNSIEDKVSTALFGYNSSLEQKELSQYVSGSLRFRDETKKDYLGHIKSSLTSRSFEKYVDTLSAISMINRYTNKDNNASIEDIKALNSTLSDFYSFRLLSHLVSPAEIHVNYEIFNYLSKTETLNKISKFTTFDEINSLALEIIEESNAWRLQNNKSLFSYDIEPFSHIEKTIKTLAILVNYNSKYLNKDELMKTLIIHNGGDKEKSQYLLDLLNAVLDPILEHWKDGDNLSSDLSSIIKSKKTSFHTKLLELNEKSSSEIKNKYEFTLSKQELLEHKINYLQELSNPDPTTTAFLKILIAENKAHNLYQKFLNSKSPQFEEEKQHDLMKKFGSYYISYEALAYSFDLHKKFDKINSTKTPLVLINNFEIQFLAYKHKIKTYTLDTPTDDTLNRVNDNIQRGISIDHDLPPFLFINKGIDKKIINILKISNKDTASITPPLPLTKSLVHK